MKRFPLFATSIATLTLCSPHAGFAQSVDIVELVVESGRPLRVALDLTSTVKRVGQEVAGTLVEPVYAYDRIVLPAGTRVAGHIASLEQAPKMTRARAMIGGDFSPRRHVVLQFDTVIRDDGGPMPIETIVTNGTANVRRQVARGSESPKADGVVAQAKQEVKQKASDTIAAAKEKAFDTIAAIKQPGKMERLKEMGINRLPYHPQFLRKGTVYDAELQAPLTFGIVGPAALASAGTTPAPSSILKARLVTTLDSAKTPRGTPLEAVVTEPVFSADHQLILPEGTRLIGEVTFSKEARRFHRNGQLRFLFESAQPPHQDATKLLASLHSVDVSGDDHVAVDEEGGTRVTNSKTRFIAPALAILALSRTADPEEHHLDGDADDAGASAATAGVESGAAGSRAISGLLGFGLIGVALGQVSHPLAIAFGVAGVVRTMYINVLGKGQELRFPADTPIQVELAPGPTSGK
jgi:hypothetical protein